MGNKPFDREVWHERERPFADDNNLEATYADQALREVLGGLFIPRISAANDAAVTTPPTSFFGDAFKARPGGALSVSLVKGIGMFGDPSSGPTAIDGVVGVNDLPPYKPLVLSQAELIAVPPNATADPRIDIIEVRYRRELIDPTDRDIMTAVPPYVFTPSLVDKTLTWGLDGQQGTVTTPAPSTAYIGYVVGVPAVSPVAPTPTDGYEKIAEIAVAAGAATITAANITEYRRTFGPYGMTEVKMRITSDTATATHVVTFVHAPPGIGFEITDGGTTTTKLVISLGIYASARAVNFHATVAFKQQTTPAGRTVLGQVENPSLSGDFLSASITAQILTNTPNFGVQAFTTPVETDLTISWGYSPS